MKLIREINFINSDFEIVEEQKNNKTTPTLTICGPYIVTEAKNENGRIYSRKFMEEAVSKYQNEMITTCRSVGELNHPDTIEINYENACHLITELKQEGNVWIGKSKILEGTPKGNILKALILNGVRVGVSTRGVGDVDKSGNVGKYALITVDVVSNPSAGNHGAFVNGIMESKNYIINQMGYIYEQKYETFENELAKLPLKSTEKGEKILSALEKFLIDL